MQVLMINDDYLPISHNSLTWIVFCKSRDLQHEEHSIPQSLMINTGSVFYRPQLPPDVCMQYTKYYARSNDSTTRVSCGHFQVTRRQSNMPDWMCILHWLTWLSLYTSLVPRPLSHSQLFQCFTRKVFFLRNVEKLGVACRRGYLYTLHRWKLSPWWYTYNMQKWWNPLHMLVSWSWFASLEALM